MMNADYKQGEKITLVCIIGNIFLSLFKLIAGYLGGSKAMIADAFHSASDVIATIVVYISIRIAKKPVDREHPYGHGKIEPIAAAFVGITLVFAAITIIKSIVDSIVTHSFVTPSLIALIAAVVSIIVKEVMFRITYDVGKKINSQSIMANAWDHRSDAYSSIGTFFGILGSMIGKYLNIHVLEYLDPIAGAVVACMIFKVAYDILKHSVKGLMDSSPDDNKIQTIRSIAGVIEGVISVPWIKARYIGRHLYVDMAVEVHALKTVEEGHDIAVLVRKTILESIKDVCEVLVHIDPVHYDDNAFEMKKADRIIDTNW